jgi:hypothetical protein
MTSPNNERDALTDAYRRASAEEAGRPSAATRRAILAEAAAAARRRTLAANEPRYVLRAVAGVAVLGVAVLLWRQMGHPISGAAPLVAAAPVEQKLDSAVTESRPTTATPLDAARAEPTLAPPGTAQPPAPTALAKSVASALAQTPSPALTESDTSQEATSKGMVVADTMQAPATPERLRSEVARVASAAAPAQDAGTAALLRQHFPQQYQSEIPHTVWLVQDAAGKVIGSGELASGVNLADITPDVERQLSVRRIGPWRIETVRNAHGQVIELGIAQAP